MSKHDLDIRLDTKRGEMRIAAHASDVVIDRDGDRVTIRIGGLTETYETNTIIAPVIRCSGEPIEGPDGSRLFHLGLLAKRRSAPVPSPD